MMHGSTTQGHTGTLGRAVLVRLAVGIVLAALVSLPMFGPRGETRAAEEMSARERLEQMRKERAREAKANRGHPTAVAGGPSWATPDDVTYIDNLLKEEWKALGFATAKSVSDGEFIRRASLDIIGRVPTYEETLAYTQNSSRDKKAELINRLLSSPEYGKHQANIWTKLVETSGPNANRFTFDEMQGYFEREFNRNRPWNDMVSEMISATGRSDENGAANFMIAKYIGGMEGVATATLTRLFLGVQTQCTECHDHPWNEWKQEQFHGMTAFFMGTEADEVRVTAPNGQLVTDHFVLNEKPYANLGEKGRFYERRNGLTLYTLPKYIDGRDVNALLRGQPAPAGGKATDDIGSFSFTFNDERSMEDPNKPVLLRDLLAKAVTAEDNPYFAKAMVNRVWFQMFGHSFVKNVDDFDNGQDEPSMPVLLDRLAEDFRKHGHDIKRLVRWVAMTDAYAMSSRPEGSNTTDAEGFFTYMLVKPMSPEQLYDSMMSVTEYDKSGTDAEEARRIRRDFLQNFRRTFGSGEVATTTPQYDGTITQALMLMNSRLLDNAVSCKPGTFLYRIMTDPKMKTDDKVNAIYLAAFSRQPKPAERTALKRLTFGSEQEMLEDVMWSVINSPEFILNH